MYRDNEVRGQLLERITLQLANFTAPDPDPMPCDRWIARSLLHKAIRRGETELASRALATLIQENRQGIWRALTIIGMEDVGVSGMDALVAVVIAGRDKAWRDRVGGDWKVAAYLARLLCAADHDQAVCDLFEHAVGALDHADQRADALERGVGDLVPLLEPDRPLVERAIAALAIGGGLADGQRHHDPFAVLEVLADQAGSSSVIDLSRAAWRLSRCPLALLLPLVWSEWIARDAVSLANDPLPPISWIGELPGYAIDQFTRSGIQVARRLLTGDAELQRLLDESGIPRSTQHRTVGDLIFLIEGSPLARRTIWRVGDELRLPYRCLADTVALGSRLPEAQAQVARQQPLIADLRRQLLPPFQARLEL